MNAPINTSPFLDKVVILGSMIDAIAQVDGWQHGDDARELAPDLFDKYYKMAEAAYSVVQQRLQPKAAN